MDSQVFSGFWSSLPRPFFALAPMEDVTDWVFREVLRSLGGPDVWFTEFAMASGIASGRRDSLARVTFHPASSPVVAQIWGNKPEDYRKAVFTLRQRGFHGVDINMGCPQHSVTAKGCCSALIKNHGLARELVLAALEAASDTGPEARSLGLHERAGEAGGPIPVSVKTRVSFTHPPQRGVTEPWFRLLLGLGIAAFTVHGRSAEQQSEGLADWSWLDLARQVRDELSPATVLLGNGDVESRAHGLERAALHGIDGIMVGRALFRDPALFATGDFPSWPRERKISLALFHLNLYETHWGQGRNYQIMKKFFKIYLQDFDGADALRDRVMATSDYAGARDVLLPFL